jgi:hypothetical protein
MAQVVERLPSKHEALSIKPNTAKEKKPHYFGKIKKSIFNVI